MSTDIGATSDFAKSEATKVTVDGRTLVVVRIDDDFYVLDDRCSHEDYSLSEGTVDVASCEIECARHGAMFSLKDGTPQAFPATQPVRTYAVSVNNDRVEVTVS
jgi:3-phenylpropionate/trans-cinnamate dioxygenase ferredoxin component